MGDWTFFNGSGLVESPVMSAYMPSSRMQFPGPNHLQGKLGQVPSCAQEEKETGSGRFVALFLP